MNNFRFLLLTGGLGLLAAVLLPATVSAQPVIVNPSFEADPTPENPGYSAITGWSPGGSVSTGYGINEGRGAFADNGAVPHGARVAFIQNDGTLNQAVRGFRVGKRYQLTYRENARGLCCGERAATLSVQLENEIIVPQHTVTVVGDSNPYRLVTSHPFTARKPILLLTFIKGGFGDSAVLIDNVQIATAK